MALTSKEAELFIGIVARIGVDNRMVHNAIEKLLKEYGYETTEIKVTAAIKELAGFEEIPSAPTRDKYERHIQACNEIREKTQNSAIMAHLAVSSIGLERSESAQGTPLQRRAFVINQLKRPEEADFLRSLYGEHYVQISCHSHVSKREARLAELIAHDHPQKPKAADHAIAAKELIQKDESEEDNRWWGQRLRDVFPSSDIVIDATTRKGVLAQLDRFFRALFGDPRVTPSVDEYGMQLARTASLRSADLSRQVGASILNRRAEIQALGCNEVPRASGGTYWEGDPHDAREFQLGKDSNDERKREVLLDLAMRMQAAGLIRDEFNNDIVLRDALMNRADHIIEDSQLMDSLEYGRTIHAEMNAITDAARGGHAIRECTLYCNTFPCHNCAKHIVASGIERVVYSVPYPKSYAEDLFGDSIVVNPPDKPTSEGRADTPQPVVFEQFIGIAGPMYGRVFEKRKWKSKDGTVPEFHKRDASFVRRTPAPAYREAEAIIRDELGKTLESVGLTPRPPPDSEGV